MGGVKCLFWYNFCCNLHVNVNKITIILIMYFIHFPIHKPHDGIYYALHKIFSSVGIKYKHFFLQTLN